MLDPTELVERLRTDPSDHESRWRLAKLLYKRCDYAEALGHLEVLQSAWGTRLNVLRYLAATYYRLGQFDDSIQVLENATRYWSHDAALRQQLAKVSESAGLRGKALDEWRSVKSIDPDNSAADRALARLEGLSSSALDAPVATTGGDSGVRLRSRMLCPVCKAENAVNFERCWQCHALLDDTNAKGSLASASSEGAILPRWLVILVYGSAWTGLAAWATYLTLRQVSLPYFSLPTYIAPNTVSGLWAESLFHERLLVFVVLAFAWPLILLALVRALTPEPRAGRKWVTHGLLLALLTYVALWTPPLYLMPSLAVLPVTLFLLVASQRWRKRIVFGFWFGAIIIGGSATISVAVAVAGIDLIRDVPVLVRYTKAHDDRPSKGHLALSAQATPFSQWIMWDSTPSDWLNANASTVTIRGETPYDPRGLEFILWEGDRQVLREFLTESSFSFSVQVTPRWPYRIELAGVPRIPVQLNVIGLLPHRPVR